MNYWLGNEYLGLGPGAHGRIMVSNKRYETMMYHIPEHWLEAVKKNGIGYQKYSLMNEKDILKERIMMLLRTKNGIEKNAYLE